MGRYMPTARKEKLIREANYQCELCGRGRGELEIHHIIPYTLTGDDSDENLIVLCSSCHARLTPKSKLTKLGQRGGTPIQRAIYTELEETDPTDLYIYGFDIVLDLVDKYTGKDGGYNLHSFYKQRSNIERGKFNA